MRERGERLVPAALSVLTRRSTGARSASARPAAAASSPKLSANAGASHSGKSPRTCAGAPSRSAPASRSRSTSLERRRRVALAGEQAGDLVDAEPAQSLQRAEHFRARRRLAEQPGRGRLAGARRRRRGPRSRRGRPTRRSGERGPSPSSRPPRDGGGFRCRQAPQGRLERGRRGSWPALPASPASGKVCETSRNIEGQNGPAGRPRVASPPRLRKVGSWKQRRMHDPRA